MFELEFLELPDGTVMPVDLNPRPYGSISLAIAAGSPLPAAWCDWLLGREGTPGTTAGGIWYRWEEGELRNFLRLLRRGRLGRALALLRPRRRTAHAYFRASDPLPLAAWTSAFTRDWWQRATQRQRPQRLAGPA
jgi:hypothetical protein